MAPLGMHGDGQQRNRCRARIELGWKFAGDLAIALLQAVERRGAVAVQVVIRMALAALATGGRRDVDNLPVV